MRTFQKLRYKLTKSIIKILTPNLYKSMRDFSLFENKFSHDHISKAKEMPRPAIKKIKEWANGNKLVGCEIGVWGGDNAKSMLKELNIKTLYLIDIWDEYQDVYKKYNTTDLYQEVRKRFSNEIKERKIVIIKGDSRIVHKRFLKEFFDFVYIDGNHNYEYIREDLKNFFPKIKDNGIIAGHDVFFSHDVFRAVKEFCISNMQYPHIDVPDFYIIKEK